MSIIFIGRDPACGDWQEWEIQSYIIQEANREGYFIEGDQNQAKRGYVAAARAKACGMKAGTPDLRVLKNNGKIIFVELKKSKGKLSKEQIEWHSQAKRRGHTVITIYVDTPVLGYMMFKSQVGEPE